MNDEDTQGVGANHPDAFPEGKLSSETADLTPPPGIVRTIIGANDTLCYACNDDFAIAFMTILTNMWDAYLKRCDPDAMFSIADVTRILGEISDRHMDMLEDLQKRTLKAYDEGKMGPC